MRRVPLSEFMARAAATDAGNRSMRAAGRTAWSVADYDAAVAEFNRLIFEQHQADDPHCTCNDCMDAYGGSSCRADDEPGQGLERRERHTRQW